MTLAAVAVAVAGAVVAVTVLRRHDPPRVALPLRPAGELSLPGDGSRFDYASLDSARGLLFVAHLGAGAVVEVDVRTDRVVRVVPGVPQVHGVLVVPGRHRVYATATGADPNLPGDQRIRTHFFNTDAFVDRLPFGAQYRYGNSARNTVIGPGIVDFDASINKKFTVSESKYVEFRTEVFNLPNHPIWNPPGRTLRNPDYGVITSTRIDSRQIQFALKMVF